MNVEASKRRAIRQRAGSLDNIFQFAHISGPVKIHQDLHRRRRNARDFFPGFARESRQKKIAPDRGCLPYAARKRRDIDRHNIQPVIQILAKRSLFERRAQIAIRRGDQPHIHFQRARSAEPFEFALLQHAQQFHLRRAGHVADFVEEQRALIREFEFSGLVRRRSGERAFFVSEKFALQQIFWNRGAIDFDKGPGRAPRSLVNYTRD